ncbi:hypothetical protein AT864_02577 [Anoxybacillus sp. P3H1B]|nr:hypothetical protein AT864_02577 [Anoxybacillus sp. P3H1B]
MISHCLSDSVSQKSSCFLFRRWKQWICRKRKIVETSFAVLIDKFHLTSIRANSVEGFKTELDDILLAYTLVVLGLVKHSVSTSTTGILCNFILSIFPNILLAPTPLLLPHLLFDKQRKSNFFFFLSPAQLVQNAMYQPPLYFFC